MTQRVPHVLVVGGGYVGLYTAYGLRRAARKGRVRVTVVDPRSAMTYQPFLSEAAAGSIEPRHVVVPLRTVLSGCDVITGRVTGLDHGRRTATITPTEGAAYDVGYDHVVLALGSVSRTLPIPGLAENAIGFHQVEEAIALGNQVIDRLDVAASQRDSTLRTAALTFVVVGAGYAGVEAFAELEDMARDATRHYPTIEPSDLRWVLVEASDRILPEVSDSLGRYALAQLERRALEVRLDTRLVSCVDGHVVLTDGTELDADTIVWTAGVRAHPDLVGTGLQLDTLGRVVCEPTLAVAGCRHAWAAGDNAAVPDLTGEDGALCSPSAQHAVRQAKVLARNILRAIDAEPLQSYRHRHVGSVASLGLHRGVAELYGVRVKGWPAWLLHRSYHMSRIPTFNRKLRVVLDWTMAMFFRREVSSLGSLQRPAEEFRRAASSTAPRAS
ncbi:NAD(P)/FAD-dependent oxidoreductase [Luteipulveratus halotolerans]|uniref:NADH dehydrogenase n=1 Tax=Luteipulveratus halotolerans TaxID=1631356 RepID=A0A0L6CM36_9MICO|nr:NAD(P)/FAD-dependent oxidoreductase [Luteipulveratus halotolerans]KNX38583.1 NADH dehydrogenase [Luteipulveratus halotolerans]